MLGVLAREDVPYLSLSHVQPLVVVGARVRVRIRVVGARAGARGLRLDADDPGPGDHDLADVAPVRVLCGAEAELVGVDEEEVEGLVCADEGAEEDAAVGDGDAEGAAEEEAEVLPEAEEEEVAPEAVLGIVANVEPFTGAPVALPRKASLLTDPLVLTSV